MIKMCYVFANSNHITFNFKKTVCIKFSGKTHDYVSKVYYSVRLG